MVPHDANKKLGLNVTEPALWNGFTRPAFLLPTDSRFNEIASLYYKELEKLFGKANYYSMDPFHELEDAGSVDFDAAGKAVLKAMKDVNPKATWDSGMDGKPAPGDDQEPEQWGYPDSGPVQRMPPDVGYSFYLET